MPGMAERDAFVLDMISTYLSGGKSSVLYKKLVDKKKLALEASAITLGQVDYNMFASFIESTFKSFTERYSPAPR